MKKSVKILRSLLKNSYVYDILDNILIHNIFCSYFMNKGDKKC